MTKHRILKVAKYTTYGIAGLVMVICAYGAFHLNQDGEGWAWLVAIAWWANAIVRD